MCCTRLIFYLVYRHFMRIQRKFSLESIGRRYESLTIEVEGDNENVMTQRIDQIYKEYVAKIQKKEIA